MVCWKKEVISLADNVFQATTIAELRETVKPLRAGCARHIGGVEQCND